MADASLVFCPDAPEYREVGSTTAHRPLKVFRWALDGHVWKTPAASGASETKIRRYTMDKERLEPNSPQEEAMWRAQVLRRTARICSAKAKELERMAKVDGNAPMRDSGTLKDVLKRIDNVMEWRFVNALGEVVLDGDILAESIDCEALRTMRYCVAEYLKRIEEREAEGKSDE